MARPEVAIERTRMIQPLRWAESVLRVLLTTDEAETIAGDLVEQYRDSVYPVKGRLRADLWFAGQVVGFAWRATWVWVAIFSVLMTGRTALDWFLPPADFYVRSAVTTYSAISIFVGCGMVAAYRSRSLRSSILVAVVVS